MSRGILSTLLVLFVALQAATASSRDLQASKCRKLFSTCNPNVFSGKNKCCSGTVCKRSPRNSSVFTCQRKVSVYTNKSTFWDRTLSFC